MTGHITDLPTPHPLAAYDGLPISGDDLARHLADQTVHTLGTPAERTPR